MVANVEYTPYDVELKAWFADKNAIPQRCKAYIIKEKPKALLLNIVDNGIERGNYWVPRSVVIKIEG
jgi:hypothetical protein